MRANHDPHPALARLARDVVPAAVGFTMKLITRLGNPAYRRGFADGCDGKKPHPPRLFRGAYQWGYDWGFMTTNPFHEVPFPFTAADVQKLKDTYRARRAAWDRKYAR